MTSIITSAWRHCHNFRVTLLSSLPRDAIIITSAWRHYHNFHVTPYSTYAWRYSSLPRDVIHHLRVTLFITSTWRHSSLTRDGSRHSSLWGRFLEMSDRERGNVKNWPNHPLWSKLDTSAQPIDLQPTAIFEVVNVSKTLHTYRSEAAECHSPTCYYRVRKKNEIFASFHRRIL
jgi:hypothetical protein